MWYIILKVFKPLQFSWKDFLLFWFPSTRWAKTWKNFHFIPLAGGFFHKGWYFYFLTTSHFSRFSETFLNFQILKLITTLKFCIPKFFNNKVELVAYKIKALKSAKVFLYLKFIISTCFKTTSKIMFYIISM